MILKHLYPYRYILSPRQRAILDDKLEQLLKEPFTPLDRSKRIIIDGRLLTSEKPEESPYKFKEVVITIIDKEF